MGRRPLLWQLFPSYVVIIALSLAAVTWYATSSLREFHRDEVARELEARARVIERQAEKLLAPEAAAALDALCKDLGKRSATRITVMLPSGQVIGDSDEDPAKMENHASPSRPEMTAALRGETGTSVRHSATLDKNMMYLAVPIRREGKMVGVLRTSLPVTAIEEALEGVHRRLALAGLAVGIVAAVFSLWISHRVSKPLAAMRQGAERFARGELEARVEVPNTEELAALAEALNQMAAQLGERLNLIGRLEGIRRDFVANVSHELKTPITSIKGFVETLLEGAASKPEDARRFLGIIAKQADRLNAIIEDLLLLSRLEQENSKPSISVTDCRLKGVLQAAIQVCCLQAEEKGIAVALHCPDDLSARVNAPLIEQAVVNLVDNALKYSEPGKSVEVKSGQTASETLITVTDHGCGIETEHLPRLFERFYRVDKARSRKLGGTGLGLAIVKHIVQAHQGRVEVESTPGVGSSFTLVLPQHPAAGSI